MTSRALPTGRVRGALEHLHAAQAILRRHPGVVGVGVGVQRKRGRFRAGVVAYVVHVRRKRTPRERDRLPRELFGVKIDVVERRGGGVRFAAGCFAAPTSDTSDYGHLGLIAKDPSGALVGLTAAHVTVPEAYPLNAAPGTRQDAMSCWDFGGSTQPVGSLAEAYFDRSQDVARLTLASNSGTIDPRLDGKVRAGAPVPVASLTPLKSVQLVIPGIPWPQGQLTEVGYSGTFDTKSDYGNDDFSGLCVFEFPDVTKIQPGWSGALICDSTYHPVALLSFGATVRPDATSSPRPTAWGWPLAPHYNFWRLGSP